MGWHKNKMTAPMDVLFQTNLARSECYTLLSAFLSFPSTVLANETDNISRWQGQGSKVHEFVLSLFSTLTPEAIISMTPV